MKRLYSFPLSWVGRCCLCLILAACKGPGVPEGGTIGSGSATVPPVSAASNTWIQTDWAELRAWPGEGVGESWSAWLTSCSVLVNRPLWRPLCEAAQVLGEQPDEANVLDYFRTNFQPWQLVNADGSRTGMVTGYYEPIIKGSRTRSAQYTWPIYGRPTDLVVHDAPEAAPQLKNYGMRGRWAGDKWVPYWSRAQIEAQGGRLNAPVLFWAQDPIDLFFMQVQGAGRIDLPDGTRVRLAYAEKNGHPYQSIGRWLVDRGELTLEKASMENIRGWARKNPQRLKELMNANPSYIFFRELPDSSSGPVGALNVPLTEGRSIAIDPQTTALGVPVFLQTTHPLSLRPLDRLVMAQDTGSAIKGAVRADFFWGLGPQAGQLAGKMKQSGRMWMLLPNGVLPQQLVKR